MNMTTLGIDLAKNVFQLHGANNCGKKAFVKRVSREKFAETVQQIPARLIGMEACGSAHYWARRFTKMGHTVKLMSPQYVKPYVKTNKNDRNEVTSDSKNRIILAIRITTGAVHDSVPYLEQLDYVKEKVSYNINETIADRAYGSGQNHFYFKR